MPAASDASVSARLRTLAGQALTADRLWAESRLAALDARLQRGAPSDRMALEITGRLEASAQEAERRSKLPLRIAYPEQLPVSGARDAILEALARHRCLVLTGETGSGKTTQLPKMLVEAGYGRRGRIAITQPRRVAAIAIADRLRDELQASEALVSHSVRFDDRSGPDTILRVMTDGLLLAELTGDPLLSRCDAVVVDEAHERSLTIDLLLGLLRRLRERRPDLVLVVSSASIAAERFAEYLGDGGASAPVVAVAGRTFPVEVRWRPPVDEDCGYLGAAVEALRSIHATEGAGDCLCFLPTERDILEADRRLRELPGAVVLPLFSRLTPGEQQRVFRPHAARKLILATNIAETSLTIPGIRFVVDTGLVRLKRYHAASRTERLPIEPTSQASCLQRAGRAGRIEAGVCIRLFGEEDFANRDPFVMPEIQRSNRAGVLLTCIDLGIEDPERFPWLDPPAEHAWRQARLLLEELGALTGSDRSEGEAFADQRSQRPSLTGMGRALAAIPADPQIGRILLGGVLEGVPHEACTIAALLSIQDPRVRPVGLEAKADAAHRQFTHEAGDLASVLKLWARFAEAPSAGSRSRLCESGFLGYRRMREWADVRHQLWSSLRQTPQGRQLPAQGFIAENWPLDRVHRAVLSGMLGNVLMYDAHERAYRAGGDRLLHVHPGSALRAGKSDDGRKGPPPLPWLVACEIVQTSRLFARLCAPIDPEWVIALGGDRIKRRHHQAQWSPQRQQVVCLETVTWKGLPVRSGRQVPFERIDPAAATALFVREALVNEDSGIRDDGILAVLAENRQVLAEVRHLRDRLRDPALLVDETWLEEWYRERLGLPPAPTLATAAAAVPSSDAPPAPAAGAVAPSAPEVPAPAIASTAALRRHLHASGKDRLRLELSMVVGAQALERAGKLFPTQVLLGGQRLQLRYRFAPGDADDGATLELREAELARIDAGLLAAAVPGWLPAMVEAWLLALPKDARRELIPLARTAQELAEAIGREDAGTAPGAALYRRLCERLGRIPPLDAQVLPPWTRLRLILRDEQGTVLYQGRDHDALALQAGAAPDRLARLRLAWETAPTSTWPGDCPWQVEEAGVRGVVALGRTRDQHGQVAVRRTVYATESAASAWHQDGLFASLEAALASELEAWALREMPAGPKAVVESALGARLGLIRRQLGLSALAELATSPIRTHAVWQEQLLLARSRLAEAQTQVERWLPILADRVQGLRRQLGLGARSPAALAGVVLAQQALQRLLGPGWPLRRPFASHAGLESLVAAYAGHLEQLRTRPEDARRRSQRAQDLIESFDAELGLDAGRWCQALGLMPQLRELAGGLETCLALLLAPTSGSGAGWAEERLRTGLTVLARSLDAQRRRIREMRDQLLDARPLAERQGLPRRTRTLEQLDRAIKGLPDLSLGADLAQQVVEAQALLARLRSG